MARQNYKVVAEIQTDGTPTVYRLWIRAATGAFRKVTRCGPFFDRDRADYMGEVMTADGGLWLPGYGLQD